MDGAYSVAGGLRGGGTIDDCLRSALLLALGCWRWVCWHDDWSFMMAKNVLQAAWVEEEGCTPLEQAGRPSFGQANHVAQAESPELHIHTSLSYSIVR